MPNHYNGTLRFQKIYIFPPNHELRRKQILCHHQQWKTSEILGSSFWQAKDPAGPSSGLEAHSTFRPLKSPGLPGFVLNFAKTPTLAPSSTTLPSSPRTVTLSSFLYHLCASSHYCLSPIFQLLNWVYSGFTSRKLFFDQVTLMPKLPWSVSFSYSFYLMSWLQTICGAGRLPIKCNLFFPWLKGHSLSSLFSKHALQPSSLLISLCPDLSTGCLTLYTASLGNLTAVKPHPPCAHGSHICNFFPWLSGWNASFSSTGIMFFTLEPYKPYEMSQDSRNSYTKQHLHPRSLFFPNALLSI